VAARAGERAQPLLVACQLAGRARMDHLAVIEDIDAVGRVESKAGILLTSRSRCRWWHCSRRPRR